ncbi:hypothetical protein ACFHVI_23020, partial [Enterobacter hormaechei]
IRCVCGKKIGPDPRNFNQRVSLGRNDLLIRTFPNHLEPPSLKNNTKAAKKATKTAALRNRGTNLSATFANSINA